MSTGAGANSLHKLLELLKGLCLAGANLRELRCWSNDRSVHSPFGGTHHVLGCRNWGWVPNDGYSRCTDIVYSRCAELWVHAPQLREMALQPCWEQRHCTLHAGISP
jgi:hypothetical protein